jgi:hypothetical protein
VELYRLNQAMIGDEPLALRPGRQLICAYDPSNSLRVALRLVNSGVVAPRDFALHSECSKPYAVSAPRCRVGKPRRNIQPDNIGVLQIEQFGETADLIGTHAGAGRRSRQKAVVHQHPALAPTAVGA